MTESMARCGSSGSLSQVQGWFSSTMPTRLGNDILVPPSREIHAQIRLTYSGNPEYLIHNPKSSVSIRVGGKALFPATCELPNLSYLTMAYD